MAAGNTTGPQDGRWLNISLPNGVQGPMEALRQLQALLRDLFQLDLADLDFGLYRLLRLKRQEVEAFLAEQMPRRVNEAFEGMGGEERALLEQEVSELASRIRKEVAEDALLDDGTPRRDYPGFQARLARELLDAYEAKRGQLRSVQVTETQKAEVCSHLYGFLSRYYEGGDFIPRRRYGARETYAIPYNGEETLFHWANRDQHYVKTGEAFRHYAFTVDAIGGPFRVIFALNEASIPPGNTKGDTRYFFPLPNQTTWNKESRSLLIPFHYRLPAEKEIERFGKNSKLQESILQSVAPKILAAVPEPTFYAALSATVEQKDGQEISLLLKRLRHFTHRNTTDYFIHRDLDGFLRRELEFYLKDQVLHLGDLGGDLDSKRRTLRVVRQLAEEVIAFLAGIENVQKRLFEKRKFVLRTDYLVPLKEVPRVLWKEVLANKAQIQAWKDLFAVDPKKVNERLLREHPTLVANTAYFDRDFTDRLLATFDDLDGATCGLLIHAENYQALRLLDRKYASKVRCIYIDPPYNTGSDEFIYKDRYRHSTWLTMMSERFRLGAGLLAGDAVAFVSCDDNELERLKICLTQEFGRSGLL
jgi:adenine-specific DNA-methyltransferase